jgi:hypothetical protein
VARKPIESDCVKASDGLLPKDAVLLNNVFVQTDPLVTLLYSLYTTE